MPREARIKNESGIYHIIVKGIKEVPLFSCNADKDAYLSLTKKYKNIFLFEVYAYCLMTSHAHFIINCCGSDISKIMKSINQCYTAYYNKLYNREGHLFKDRFKSKLVNSEGYFFTLSAYIHNNPKDIDGFKHSVEKYPYSSLGIYLNIDKDIHNILDKHMILCHFKKNQYLRFVKKEAIACSILNTQDEPNIYILTQRIIHRNFDPKNIMTFVAKYTKCSSNINLNYPHEHSDFISLSALLMRSLCNFTFADICHQLGDMTLSCAYRFSELGYNLLTKNKAYSSIIKDFLVEF